MYLLLLIIGIILGVYLKDFIPKFIEKFIITYKNNYKVKFNVYFAIHRNNSRLDEILIETIEISVSAKDEDEVNSLVADLIKDGVRFEIENIEKL